MTKSKMKIVKLIGRKGYEVEMLETTNGYYIRYECRSEDGQGHFSELIKDFHIASYMFDLKLRDLEGH